MLVLFQIQVSISWLHLRPQQVSSLLILVSQQLASFPFLKMTYFIRNHPFFSHFHLTIVLIYDLVKPIICLYPNYQFTTYLFSNCIPISMIQSVQSISQRHYFYQTLAFQCVLCFL